jgi:hypothetical protein
MNTYGFMNKIIERYIKIMKTNRENKLETKIMDWFDGVKMPSAISFLFLVYCMVDNTLVITPMTHAKIPRMMTRLLIKELELILVVKCNEVVKKPTPVIEIAVRIHARYVLSFAKCCCAYFTLSPGDSSILYKPLIND